MKESKRRKSYHGLHNYPTHATILQIGVSERRRSVIDATIDRVIFNVLYDGQNVVGEKTTNIWLF
jgi:hypothetical protein